MATALAFNLILWTRRAKMVENRGNQPGNGVAAARDSTIIT